MNDKGKKDSDRERGLNLMKFGYWAMVFAISLMSLVQVLGAPAEAATNMSMFPMFLLVFFLGYLGLSRRYKDERLVRIGSRAMFTSWGSTLITPSTLATLRATYLPLIGAGQILGIIIFVMISSMAVSNEVYKRKGDVDW